jgi:hypothetical protein
LAASSSIENIRWLNRQPLRAWHEGNLDFSELEAYLAGLLEAQLKDAD